MAYYKVKVKNSAQKEIRRLASRELRNKIVDIIDGLYNNPIPNDAKKIKGSSNVYRIRQGNYRIVYQVYKNELIVIVIRIRHRKDAYKGF